jgi:hypothetical protein
MCARTTLEFSSYSRGHHLLCCRQSVFKKLRIFKIIQTLPECIQVPTSMRLVIDTLAVQTVHLFYILHA